MRPRQGPLRPISIVARPRSPQSQPVGWVRHCVAKGPRPVCRGWEGGPGKVSVFLLMSCAGDAPTLVVELWVVHSASPLAFWLRPLAGPGPIVAIRPAVVAWTLSETLELRAVAVLSSLYLFPGPPTRPPFRPSVAVVNQFKEPTNGSLRKRCSGEARFCGSFRWPSSACRPRTPRSSGFYSGRACRPGAP